MAGKPATPAPSIDALAQGQAEATNAVDNRGGAQAPAQDGIRLDTSVEIGVPPREVFEFWRALENFPRFMKHVIEVRREADNRYLWRVSGPMGTEVSWHADVTDVETDRRIAWASDKGAGLENRGDVRFEPIAGGTRVQVRITYAPPAGVVGHAVATLMGMNPSQQMREDLERCRTLLEEGRAGRGADAVAAGTVRRDEPSRRSVH